MKSFISEGNDIEVVATADVTSGDVITLGAFIGIAKDDAAIGYKYALQLTGVVERPRATGTVTGIGVALYWDALAKNVTTTAASNPQIGWSASEAQAADALIWVRLSNP